MRSLWNVVSFLAVVNLLALAFFGAWLWQSDRLSAERVRHVREVFSRTVVQDLADAEARLADANAAKQRKFEAQRAANPATDSDTQLREISLIAYENQQARRRLQDERDILLAQLAAESTRIDDQKIELQRQRLEWENAVRADRQRKNDEQFLQTVKQLEQLPPKQSKQMITQIIELKQFETAVAYLDAMNARAAGKILKEFKSEAEIRLATELLERLRTFGLESSAAAPPGARQTSPRQGLAHANDRASAK